MTQNLPHLAPAELEIMKVLWDEGPRSAREVHDSLGKKLDWAPSTTRTVIDRLVRKDVVRRRSVHGLHVYEPVVSRAEGIAGLVRSFARQVLELREVPVPALFAESDALDPEEIGELQRLLDEQAEAEE